MSTLVMSEQQPPHHHREETLDADAGLAPTNTAPPTAPTTAPTTATTTVTGETQPSSSIDPAPPIQHLDAGGGGGLSGDETAVESPHRAHHHHSRTKSAESDSPHPLAKSVDSRYHQPAKSVDSHKRTKSTDSHPPHQRTKSTDSHHQRTKSTTSRSPPASPGNRGGYPPSPGSSGYPPSPSAAVNTAPPPPSSFRASGFLDFLHSAGSKRSSVYEVERDSEVAAVVMMDDTDQEEDERARATALRAGMDSRMRREWDELEREEREIEMEQRRLEAEEEENRGPSSAVAPRTSSSGPARGARRVSAVGGGGLVHKTKHPMSSVPRSSYYTGPPAMGSAFGSAPVGQIGVHFPREIVRVERDYTGGELCQFYPNFLMELEGRVTPTEFMETINSINEILVSAHGLTASFWDNALSALTLFTWSLVFRSHYDKEMQRLQGTIEEWNRQVYNPRGLNILWPRSSGFLFLEIEYY